MNSISIKHTLLKSISALVLAASSISSYADDFCDDPVNKPMCSAEEVIVTGYPMDFTDMPSFPVYFPSNPDFFPLAPVTDTQTEEQRRAEEERKKEEKEKCINKAKSVGDRCKNNYNLYGSAMCGFSALGMGRGLIKFSSGGWVKSLGSVGGTGTVMGCGSLLHSAIEWCETSTQTLIKNCDG